MAAWQAPAEESRQLLALQPAIRIDELNPPELSQEQLFRTSYLIGIYRPLHVLHGDKLADEWVKLPNTNVMFSGEVPLIYMILGGVCEPCRMCGSCSTRVAPETDEIAPLLKPTGKSATV